MGRRHEASRLRSGNLSLIVRGYGASVGLIEIVRCGTSIGFPLLSERWKSIGSHGKRIISFAFVWKGVIIKWISIFFGKQEAVDVAMD